MCNLKKNFEINPTFYWELIFFITLIAIIAFLIFGYHVFINTNQEPVLPVGNDATQVGTVDKNSIENVINLFSEKAEISNQILNSSAPIVDPSQ